MQPHLNKTYKHEEMIMNIQNDKQYYTVYKTTNLVNGKIYVGFHSTDNLEDGYLGSGKLLKRAVEKHGEENFSKKILAVFDTREEAEALEREIVNKEFIERDDTYNLSLGGNVCILYGEANGFYGKKHKQETIDQIQSKLDLQREEMGRKTSEGLKAFYASDDPRAAELKAASSERMYSIVIPASKTPEALAKLSASMKGKVFTDEHRANISKSQTGIKRYRSEEHNKNIGDANRGKPRPYVAEKINKNPEKIRKTAEKHRGMKRSEDACKNISESKYTQIYHTPHGDFFSPSQFKKATGLSEGMLRNRCIVKTDMVIKTTSLNTATDLTKEQKKLHIGKTWKEMGWFTTPYKRE